MNVLTEALQALVNYKIWLTVLAVSIYGASLGLIPYFAGKKGVPEVEKKFPQVDPDKLNHYHGWYQRWGARVLLLSGLPVLGTFLTLGAGIYGVGLAAFALWSLIALVIRNWVMFLFLNVIIQAL